MKKRTHCETCRMVRRIRSVLIMWENKQVTWTCFICGQVQSIRTEINKMS